VARLEEALDRLLSEAAALPAEDVSIGDAPGRVAAEEVRALVNVPHFARPAMDGYVCHDDDIRAASQDRPVLLRITGAVRPGEVPGPGPERGEAWAIATGAPMPSRGDRVVPLEAVRRIGDDVRVELPPGRKTHVAAPGEAIREGALLVEAGDVVGPHAAGALSACGIRTVRVHRRPRVALVATGDELVDVAEADRGAAALPPGRVFNSNAVAVAGLLRAAGCEVEYRGLVRDAPDQMRGAFEGLLGQGDVVLSTGGVSVGRHDVVHRTWLDLGARRIVGRVDLKPGGPFFAARVGDAWAVGLSGTPVACLAAFHLLARPLLLRLAGRRRVVRPVLEVMLAGGFPRATDQMRALWARVEPQERGRPMAEVLPRDPMGDMASLLGANALVLVPPGTPPLPPGSRVTALALDRDEDRDRLTIRPPVPGPLVVGVTGESAGGKTTVLVDLVRRLAGEGIRAVAVKHAAHGFDPDRPGSDSARMTEAGAGLVILAGPAETVLRVAAPVRDPDRVVSLATMVAEEMWGVPPAVVLIEGFQHPSGSVIQVGPQKDGLEAGEVLARVPAVTRMDEEALRTELLRVVEVVRSRVHSNG
jgi:molybdopterin molybdotransferase